jgi:hypothetical protein
MEINRRAAGEQIILMDCLNKFEGVAVNRFSGQAKANSPFLELARVLVRFDHVARIIVNANHSAV